MNGVLRDYAMGDVLREATETEAKASRRAKGSGSMGQIRVSDHPRAAKGYDAVMLGLRMAESRGRRMNTITNGTNYTRAYDSLTVCTPLARWTAMDVHAFLASREVPLLPVYGCIDPGMEWDGIRKSWWIAGGGPARMGSHYAWLRRWWPALWDRAASIDPSVRDLS